MKRSYLLLTGILLLATGVYAAKDREWQDGKLKDVNEQSRASESHGVPFGGGVETRSIVAFDYTIETAERFYVASFTPPYKLGGLVKIQKDPIDLDINGSVKFAVEKSDLYLKDRNGKEYKLRILKQGLKNPS